MHKNFNLICEVDDFLKDKVSRCVKDVIDRVEQFEPSVVSKKLTIKIKAEPYGGKVNIKKFEITLDEELVRRADESFIRWLIAHEIAHIDCRIKKMTPLAPSFWRTFLFLLRHPKFLIKPWLFAFTAKILEDIYVNRKIVEWGFIEEFAEFAEHHYIKDFGTRATFAGGITELKDKLIYFLGEDYLTDILHFLDKDKYLDFYEKIRNISIVFYSLFPREVLKAVKRIYEEIWKHEFPISSKSFGKIFNVIAKEISSQKKSEFNNQDKEEV